MKYRRPFTIRFRFNIKDFQNKVRDEQVRTGQRRRVVAVGQVEELLVAQTSLTAAEKDVRGLLPLDTLPPIRKQHR